MAKKKNPEKENQQKKNLRNLTYLTMDSTIGEFRKKFREDSEFQEHCILQRLGSNVVKQNVNFMMALLLGAVTTHKNYPESRIYCLKAHGPNTTNWVSSLSSKLGIATQDEANEQILNLYKGILGKGEEELPTKSEIESITIQQLKKQLTSYTPVKGRGKNVKYTYDTLINSANDVEEVEKTLKALLAPSAMEKAADLIRRGEARQIVFTGAPGTGKTYVAKELANHFCAMGKAGTLPAKNGEEHPYVQVQFHPSYDYTDFVEGLRPIELESANASNSIFFGKVDGQFKQFCRTVVEKNNAYITQKTAESKALAAQLYRALTDRAGEIDTLSQMLQQVEKLEAGSTSFDVLFKQIRTKQALAYIRELERMIPGAETDDTDSQDRFADEAEDTEINDDGTEDTEINGDEDSAEPDTDSSREEPDLELETVWNAFEALIHHRNLNDAQKQKIEASRDVMFAAKNQLNELTQETLADLLNQITKKLWFADRNSQPRYTSEYIDPIKKFLSARINQQISPEEHNRYAEILLLASKQEQADKLYRILYDGSEKKEHVRELSDCYRNALLKKFTEVLISQLQSAVNKKKIPSESDMDKLAWLKNRVSETLPARAALDTLVDSITELRKNQNEENQDKETPDEENQDKETPDEENQDEENQDEENQDEENQTEENPPSVKDLLPSLEAVAALQESDFGISETAVAPLKGKALTIDPERLEYPLYFFIIDEINRANLSKVFGELMYCLEKGKRGKKNAIKTQYQNLDTYDISGIKLKDLPADPKKPAAGKKEDVFEDAFYIPKNIVVIGTMNDIDRSVDSMDFALRRRFEWIEFEVNQETLMRAFEAPNFGKGINQYASVLSETVMKLNEYLTAEEGAAYGLTQQHYISHGYFADLPAYLANGSRKTAATYLTPILTYVWDYRIESLLREYLRGHSSAEIEKFINSARKKWLPDT